MNTFVAFAICLRIVSCVEIPTDIQKCHFGDEECIKGSINQLIRHYPKGIPNLGISPFDDFRPSDLLLFDSPKVGGLWMTFGLKNQTISGCENATVTLVRGFDRNPNEAKLEIELNIPRLIQRSQYDMQLRWLSMVQSNTTGLCTAEFQNVSLILNLKVIVKYQKKKRYLKIYELVPQVEIGRFHIQLDDLYKDNLDLTLAINRVYNDNWLEFWNDIEPKVMPGISKSGALLLDKIFETISYDDMFLPI